jgi:hypothetical protein
MQDIQLGTVPVDKVQFLDVLQFFKYPQVFILHCPSIWVFCLFVVMLAQNVSSSVFLDLLRFF